MTKLFLLSSIILMTGCSIISKTPARQPTNSGVSINNYYLPVNMYHPKYTDKRKYENKYIYIMTTPLLQNKYKIRLKCKIKSGKKDE